MFAAALHIALDARRSPKATRRASEPSPHILYVPSLTAQYVHFRRYLDVTCGIHLKKNTKIIQFRETGLEI